MTLPSTVPAREVVVVVGAGPGMGQAVARRFVRERGEGTAVALLARSADRLAPLVAELASLGAKAAAFAADVGDEASLRAGFAAVRDRLGDPTVLVYNPSMWVPGAATATVYDAFLAGLRVGVAGLLVAAQEVAAAMRAAGRGTILVTGGGLAFLGSTQSAGLAVQKAGVRSLTLSLADELGPAGVHVATVTIRGTVGSGPEWEPDRIAEEYWRLHTQPPGSWETEVVYDG